jgi:hypothetical protein
VTPPVASRERSIGWAASAPPALLAAILWTLWIGAFAIGEKVPVNDGLGWDGKRFARMVEEGPKSLLERQINSYYVQRVGPSYAVRAGLALSGAPAGDASIRIGFIALNAVVLSASLFLLLDASRSLGATPASRWLLLLGLFANLPNARLPVYYAPIGDSTAFFIGSLIAWGYVTRRFAAVIVGFALAIVCWPAAFALLPLLLWPRRDAPVTDSSVSGAARADVPAVAGIVLTVVLGAAGLAILWWGSEMPAIEIGANAATASLAANAVHMGAAAAVVLVVATRHGRAMTWRVSVVGSIAVLVLLAASVLYVRGFESGSAAFGANTYVREILLFVKSRAFTAIAGHAAYFGLLAIVAMALFPAVLAASARLGAGGFLAVALAGLMSVDAESRRLNASWPLVGLVAALTLDGILATRSRRIAFIVAAILVSKLWWPLSGPELLPSAHQPGNYMNIQGPNMSAAAAVTHLVVSAVVFLWLAGLARQASREPAPSS